MRKVMWKILFIMWISSFAVSVNAANEFKCGEYEIAGVIRKVDGQNVLKIYEGSMSEAVLGLAPDLAELAEVYLDSAVTLKGRMQEPVKNYKGKVESLLTAEEIKNLTSPDKPYTARFMREDIKDRVPDPLHPDLDSGLKLIKEGPCGEPKPMAPHKKKKTKK